jgi:hypothetical protein
MKRTEEIIDADGYKSIYVFDDIFLLETTMFRPDGSLASRVEYHWDFAISRYDPIEWKEYGDGSRLMSSSKAVGFDDNGIYKERIFYDENGKEKFRRPR